MAHSFLLALALFSLVGIIKRAHVAMAEVEKRLPRRKPGPKGCFPAKRERGTA